MSRACFFTIGTASHLLYARALALSIRQFGAYDFHVLLSDRETAPEDSQADEGVRLWGAGDVQRAGFGRATAERHPDRRSDAFRWSMKPVMLDFFLTDQRYDAACYVDWDLHFFADPAFLLDQLAQCGVMLSPHNRSTLPSDDAVAFELNFRDGIFNGGFVGGTPRGLEAIRWWATACRYKCEVDCEHGLYVDQKYLDLLHSRFEGVDVIRHKGCNVAEWNRVDCRRVRLDDGQVVINGDEPIVFIHFDALTVRDILSGKEPLLEEHLRTRQAMIKRCDPRYRDVFERKDELLAQTLPARDAPSQPPGGLLRRASSRLADWIRG